MGTEVAPESVNEQKPGINIGLWRAGLVALFAAVLSNILAHFGLSFLFDYPPDFIPLRATSVAVFTGIAALGATLVFAWFRRSSDRPVTLFRRTAWIILAVLTMPTLVGFFLPELFPIPGSSPEAFLLLIPFHLIAAMVIIGLLTRITSD